MRTTKAKTPRTLDAALEMGRDATFPGIIEDAWYSGMLIGTEHNPDLVLTIHRPANHATLYRIVAGRRYEVATNRPVVQPSPYPMP